MNSRLSNILERSRLAICEIVAHLCRASKGDCEGMANSIELSALEERILLSASPVGPIAEELCQGDCSSQDANNDAPTEISLVSTPTWESTQSSREVVFVDSSVPNYQQLLADLAGQTDNRLLEIHMLDYEFDGIQQINSILNGHSDIDSVHIVSHGSAGSVKLGSTWLNFDNLQAYAGDIANWNLALGSSADILFYGCDLAGSVDGKALIDSIASLTGADVAASDDFTGHIQFGGDWDLEYAVGSIETHIVFSEALQQEWMQTLNVVVDASSSGTTPDQASVTISHTTSGTDRLMLVSVTTDPHGESVSSITYNGNNLTLVGSAEGPGAHSRAEIWALVAPQIGSADVIVTLTGAGHQGVIAGVMTFNGVDQTTPFENFATNVGTSTTATATVTSSTGDLVFGVVGSHFGASATPDIGQTEYWDIVANQTNSSGTIEAGAPSVTSSWTVNNDDWSVAAVSVNAIEELTSTGEFLVNDTDANQQVTSAEDRGSQQAVSMAADGSYTVVWSSLNQDGFGQGVYFQRFDSTGTAITAELPVNQTPTNDQQWARVASADDGTFVVTWTSDQGASKDVYYRRFGADGTALTNELVANTSTSGSQKNSVIAMSSDSGEFTIAWQGNGNQPGHVDGAGIFAQRFDSLGVAIGNEFRVNTNTANSQSDPAIGVNDSGDIVIVWDDGNGFHFQRFDNTGAPQSGQTPVDASASAGNGAIAVGNDGSFVVTWREGGAGTNEIYARRYDNTGAPLGLRFVVNTTTINDQTNPSISMDAGGNFIVVWESDGFGLGGIRAEVRQLRYSA